MIMPKCPHCGYIDMNALDDLPNDNSWIDICESCGKEYEVWGEYEIHFSTNKIKYYTCDSCKKSTRKIRGFGTVPFPEKYKGMKICDECYWDGLEEEYEERGERNGS